jgi:hypothetical protein
LWLGSFSSSDFISRPKIAGSGAAHGNFQENLLARQTFGELIQCPLKAAVPRIETGFEE